MRYFVTIGRRTVEVDLSGEHALVDGIPMEASLATIPGTRSRHLLIGAESHALLASADARRGVWHIDLGGNSLTAEVVDERTRAIREMIGATEAEAPKNIVAPMPGLVVRINVEIGQHVTAGFGVIVVEAMKMENELRAPADGVVASIEIVPGQPVEKGAVLIVFE